MKKLLKKWKEKESKAKQEVAIVTTFLLCITAFVLLAIFYYTERLDWQSKLEQCQASTTQCTIDWDNVIYECPAFNQNQNAIEVLIDPPANLNQNKDIPKKKVNKTPKTEPGEAIKVETTKYSQGTGSGKIIGEEQRELAYSELGRSEGAVMLAICHKENGIESWGLDCTRTHKNKDGTTDYGLCQINSLYIKAGKTTKADLLDCTKNMKFAIGIRKGWGNFKAWVDYKNGLYKKYLYLYE